MVDISLNIIAGLGGATIYAAPRLVVCRRSCRTSGEPFSDCLLEFFVAVLVGTLAAWQFAPYASTMLSHTEPDGQRAIASIVGLVANPVAPVLIRVFSAKEILKAILRNMGTKP